MEALGVSEGATEKSVGGVGGVTSHCLGMVAKGMTGGNGEAEGSPRARQRHCLHVAECSPWWTGQGGLGGLRVGHGV